MAGWLITLIVIFANGFFVAAEFAFVKLRGSQLDVLIKQGNQKAILMKKIVDHLDDYLSACQLGITLTSLILGWIAEPLIATQLMSLNQTFSLGFSDTLSHGIAIPITFFIITVLHIVLGELAPKSFAIRDALTVSTYCAEPLYRFYRIFRPFIHFLNKLSNIVLGIFGIHGSHEEQSHSEEELRMIVIESEEDGHINAGERELIHNVFEFDNKEVSEIMTPAHKIFALSTNKRSVASIPNLLQEGYSRIPLYEGGINNITGWILIKDIVQHYINNSNEVDIQKFIRPMLFVPENMKIADCLKFLQLSHYHMAIVTSEYGTTLGLVTMEDILEELVGDIHDEGDEKQSIVEARNDNSFVIDASASVNDVNEHLPIAIPEGDEYDTISGYINKLFGRIPSLHEEIQTDDYKITISKRKKQRTEQIILQAIRVE